MTNPTYTRKHIEFAVRTYIKLRERDGLSRDTSAFGAVEETVKQAELEQAVLEDLRMLQSKRKTDKLPPIEEIKQ